MKLKIMRRLNLQEFEQEQKLTIDPSMVPTLVSEATMREWLKDDPTPYFKLQKIAYPIRANKLVYKRSFFESFLGKLKDHPIPGSKSGHTLSNAERAPTDFILVGGKVEGDEDKGHVLLKTYIPPKGEQGDNSTFIAENRSGMVHYSIVTYPVEQAETADDGSRQTNVVESVFGERNDAVDWGTGAMEQVTNTRTTNVKPKEGEGMEDFLGRCIPVLVEEGNEQDQAVAICHREWTSNKVEKNSAVGGDEDTFKGEDMNREELLKAVNSLAAAKITLSEVAEAMGAKGELLTPEHTEALRVMNALKADGSKDPVKELKELRAKVDADAGVVRNAKLDATFGKEDKEGKNLLRKYAADKVGDAIGEELEKRLNALKTDPVALKLKGDQMDHTSEFNHIGSVDHKDGDAAGTEESGRRVDTL